MEIWEAKQKTIEEIRDIILKNVPKSYVSTDVVHWNTNIGNEDIGTFKTIVSLKCLTEEIDDNFGHKQSFKTAIILNIEVNSQDLIKQEVVPMKVINLFKNGEKILSNFMISSIGAEQQPFQTIRNNKISQYLISGYLTI